MDKARFNQEGKFVIVGAGFLSHFFSHSISNRGGDTLLLQDPNLPMVKSISKSVELTPRSIKGSNLNIPLAEPDQRVPMIPVSVRRKVAHAVGLVASYCRGCGLLIAASPRRKTLELMERVHKCPVYFTYPQAKNIADAWPVPISKRKADLLVYQK